jgi:spermidine synthase/GNAT superfamily N-acetyltransferase
MPTSHAQAPEAGAPLPLVDPADLPPQGKEAALAALAQVRLEPIRDADSPAFDAAWELLASYFGPLGELEDRETLRGFVRAPRMQYAPGLEGSYHLIAAWEGGALVGVRDCWVDFDHAAGVCVVGLSHSYVVPAWRRRGLATLFRTVPQTLARQEAAARGVALPTLIVVEMEPADPDDPDTVIRLIAYGRSGFGVLDPARLRYSQVEFRDLLDAAHTAQPMLVLVRTLGLPEGPIPPEIVASFPRIFYATHRGFVPPGRVDPSERTALGALLASPEPVGVLPLPDGPGTLDRLRPLVRSAVLALYPPGLRGERPTIGDPGEELRRIQAAWAARRTQPPSQAAPRSPAGVTLQPEQEPGRDRLATVLYATGGVFEVEITRRLAERRSAFQEVLVADTVAFGRCLVLDGVMQTASTDIHLYDDAILARLRLSDRRVLIVGGGDGYVARTALARVPELELVVVDIDPVVVELAEAWLNPGFTSDPRITLRLGDGVAFARDQAPHSYDGVVLDLTDIPLDPARSEDVERLFREMIAAVLPTVKPGGWCAVQGGPSRVPPGERDVARLVGELLASHVHGLIRQDVFLPSYGEKNTFFHGLVGEGPAPVHAPAPAGIHWRDRTVGLGLATALALQPVHAEPSPAGPVEVFDHERLGRALVVDGALQDIAEDASWRELLVHVPLLGGAVVPRSVLIVGGGDGLVLAQVLQHAFIERVAVWDNNPVLPQIGASLLGTGAALADPRVRRVPTPDHGPYDVILIARPDLRQPGDASAVGARLAGWLAPDGVVADADAVVLQRGGPRWYRDVPGYGPDLRAASGLKRVGRYFGTGAVVPGGFWGFDLLGHAPQDRSAPRTDHTGHHYNAELHSAAFALPRFFRELA